MTENLTIFITTINRHNFLNKLLDYYSANNFKGKIIIGDSTKITYVNSSNLKNLNFEIYTYNENEKQQDIFFDLIKKIDTPLAVYTGDDDYLDVEIVDEIIIKCLRNSNLVINLGYIALFVDESLSPSYLSCPFYSCDLSSVAIDNQLYQNIYIKKYRSLMFSIASTIKWKSSIESAIKFRSKSVGCEIAIGYGLLVNSIFKMSDKIALIRLQHSGIYVLSDTSESLYEKIKLAEEVFGISINEFKIKDIYTTTPNKVELRKNILLTKYDYKNNYEVLNKVVKILKPSLNNINNISIIYWGNNSVFSILLNFLQKFENEKFILILSADLFINNELKNLLDKFSTNFIEIISLSPYIKFSELDKINMLLEVLKGKNIKYFISISYYIPLEKYLIKKLQPNKVILIWPHMSNFLNHYKFYNSILQNRKINNFIFFKNINKKQIVEDIINNILSKINNLTFNLYLFLLMNLVSLNEKSFLIYSKKELIRIKNYYFNKIKKFKNLIFLKPVYLTYRSLLPIFKLVLYPITFIYFLLLKIFKFLVNKSLICLLVFDLILTRRFNSLSLIDSIIRNKISPLSYYFDQRASVFTFKVISYIFLNQNFKYYLSKEYLYDSITQIGSVPGCDIYVPTEHEKFLLSKLYPNSNIYTFNVGFKKLNSNLISKNVVALLAISIGLLPKNNFEKNNFIIEINSLIENNGINILYFRPHPQMNKNDINYFYNFLKSNSNINVLIDDLSLTESLLRTNFLFCTISGIITEIDKFDLNKIFILKTLSSIQFKNLDMIFNFYPELNK